MKKREWRDPYGEVLEQFNRSGVRYVVVGMSGINYYARKPAEMFATLDYDLFLEPTIKNIERAVQELVRMGFTVGTSGGSLKAGEIPQLVRHRQTLVATTSEGLTFDLLLQVSGYPFSELSKDAATFTVQGVSVRVGRLSKLLQSKKLADRRKDRDFLRRYGALLDEE